MESRTIILKKEGFNPSFYPLLKKSFLLIFFIGVCMCNVFSQTDIITSYNSTHSGRSITLVSSKTYNNKNEFGIGLRYNINKLAHDDDQQNVFLKRQYATSFGQHWGIEAFYNRYIIRNWESVKPFVFYDLQLSYSETRNRMFLPVFYTEEFGWLFREEIEFFGPFMWIEQCVGIGFKVKLAGNFFMYQKIGAGMTFILGEDQNLGSFNNFEWEFAGLIQAGIGYRL